MEFMKMRLAVGREVGVEATPRHVPRSADQYSPTRIQVTMISPQDRPELEEDRNEQELGRFDIERQFSQRRAAASGTTPKDNPFRRFINCCNDSLRKVQGLKPQTHLLQIGTRSTTSENTSPQPSLTIKRSSYTKAGQCCFLL